MFALRPFLSRTTLNTINELQEAQISQHTLLSLQSVHDQTEVANERQTHSTPPQQPQDRASHRKWLN